MPKLLLSLIAAASLCGPLHADDWPYWLGPLRNGSSPETKLLTTWPKGGPPLAWKMIGGDGYSTVVVAKSKAITLVQHDDAEFVLAVDAFGGKKLWETKVAEVYKNQYGNGPRSTPSIDGNFVYVQMPNGPLACLEAEKGTIVWSVDLLKEFGAKNISWGLSASPLVEGDLVYTLPGGKGAGLVALNKLTGKVVWKTADDRPGYATPMPVTVAGQKQIIFFTATGLVSTTPDKGDILWRVSWKTEFDCNICTPLLIGKDQLFVTSGEENGCVLFKLTGTAPEVVWESKGPKSVMMNYWANAVAHDGYLYGVSGEFHEKKMDLNCVELKSGKLMWSKKEFGKAAVTLADGHLFITTKKGDLVLVRANSKEYEEKGRATVLGENRTSPTIANRRLYVRDRQKIYCFDLGQ